MQLRQRETTHEICCSAAQCRDHQHAHVWKGSLSWDQTLERCRVLSSAPTEGLRAPYQTTRAALSNYSPARSAATLAPRRHAQALQTGDPALCTSGICVYDFSCVWYSDQDTYTWILNHDLFLLHFTLSNPCLLSVYCAYL